MGGEFGDEDERLITRLENTQYDPSAAGISNGLEDGDEFGSLGGGGVSMRGIAAPPGAPPGSGPMPGQVSVSVSGQGVVPGSGQGPGSVSSNNQGQVGVNASNASLLPGPWSGPSGPSNSNPGSVSSNSDNRGGSSSGNGPPGSQEDKKLSPLSQ